MAPCLLSLLYLRLSAMALFFRERWISLATILKEISSPLINQLLPRMIDDAFKLTIDDDFSVSSHFIKQESKFPVDYHSNDENLWDKYTIL